MAEVRLEATGGQSLDELARRLEKLEQSFVDLKAKAAAASGQPIDYKTEPAEADLSRLIKEFDRLNRAFDSAQRGVSFARLQNELKGTAASAAQLANAEARLASTARLLIQVWKDLPPELRKSSGEMDKVGKEADRAEKEFRQLNAETAKTKQGLGGLISSINGLRAGFASFLAALGVQQIVRLSRAIIRLGSDAVETKLAFDKLIPGLKAFTGSTTLAEETAARLAVTADRLRVPMAGLIDPFNGIVAAGREAGLEIGEINNLFESALVSSRAFGKGAAEVQGLLKAIQDVAAKGTASLEEFRRQMGNNIPNAIPALAAGLSEAEGRIVTTSEAVARISSGSLKAADALRALAFGFEKLNAEAAKNQLEKLQADLGGLQRAAERAQTTFGDALEPALRKLVTTTTDLLNKNQDLIGQLGELAGAGLSGVSFAVRELDETFEAIEARQKRLAQDGLFWADVIQKIPGFEKQARSLREVSDTFNAVTAASREAFERVAANVEGFAQRGKVSAEEVAAAQERLAERAVKAQKTIAAEGTKTAEQILSDFQRSFAEQARAAGISEDEILEAQKNLAKEVGEIQDELARRRKELEEQVRQSVLDNGKLTIEDQERVAFQIVQITRQSVAERQALQERALEDIKKSNAERLRLEEEARQKIIAEAEKIVEGARVVAEQRIADDEALADRRQEIEREADEKIVEAKEQFVENLQKPKADREKLEQELADRVVEIERDAAEKIRAEEDRLAKAAEQAAERRIKAEEKVREDRRKSIDQLRELTEQLEEISQGEEGTSALGKLSDDAEELAEGVEAATSSLGDFLVTLDQINAGDLGDPLSGLSGVDPRSGANAADFFSGISQGAGDAGEAVGDFRGQLDQALEAAEGLTGGARQAILDLVARYADLAQAGTATREDFASFATDLTAIGSELGFSLDNPVEQIRQRIEELRSSQASAAESAQETAQSFQEAGATAGVVWDPLTSTLSTVEENAEGAATAAENLGVRVERTADGINVTNEALQGTQGASETAAEGLRQTGEAANQAAVGLTAAGEAVAPLKDEIVGEGEPEKIRLFGEAAGTAAEPVRLLSEGAGALALASTTLGEQLPLIQAALPEIQTSLTGILETIGDSEIDFGEIGVNVAALQEPLQAISVSLTAIDTAAAGLPEKIDLLRAAAGPLFEQTLAAADDQRFNRIAEGLTAIDTAARTIPEPLERIQAALTKLADRQADIQTALQVTKDGLAGVASEEILTALDDLIERLDTFQKQLGVIADTSGKILATWQELDQLMPGLSNKVREYSGALSQASAAEIETTGRGEELAKTLGIVRDRGSEAVTELNRLGEESAAAVETLNGKLEKTVELLNKVRDAAQQANESTSAISVGTGA